MSIQGWLVQISTLRYGGFKLPSCCSNCGGPHERDVKTKKGEKNGTIFTTLTLRFPYCLPCAKRVTLDKIRRTLVLTFAVILGIALPIGAWACDVLFETGARLIIAVPIAVAIMAPLAFVTRLPAPKPPKTARGEAVILQDTSGTVLCTSQRFAQLICDANGIQMKPGRQRFTTELKAIGLTTVFSLWVFIFWVNTFGRNGHHDEASAPAPPHAVASPVPPGGGSKATPAHATTPPSTPKKANSPR